jgi:putative hydrolase of the HAD superfamily
MINTEQREYDAKNTILFDLGGTLAHYYSLSEFALLLEQGINNVQDYLRAEGLLTITSEEAMTATGRENYEAADYRVRPLEGRLGRIFQLDLAERGEEFSTKLCAQFMKPIFANGFCYEDTLRSLRELKALGFKVGIVSNTSWGSPASLWREELNRLRLSELVNAAVFCREVGWRKPARQIFEFAMERMKTNPEKCIFVGDDPRWDVAGPRAVGMMAWRIDRGNTHPDPEERPLRSLHELLRRLRQRQG